MEAVLRFHSGTTNSSMSTRIEFANASFECDCLDLLVAALLVGFQESDSNGFAVQNWGPAMLVALTPPRSGPICHSWLSEIVAKAGFSKWRTVRW